MISLGLDAAGMAAYLRTLGTHHEVRTTARVLDLDHQPVLDVSDRVIEGQVDWDTTAETMQTGSLTLYDPRRETGLAGASVTEVGASARNLVRVFLGVRPPGGAWVDVPLMTGAVTKAEQVGDEVRLELQSKSVLVNRAVHKARTWPRGTLARDVIRDVLLMCGEVPRYMDLGDSPVRLTQPETLPATWGGWRWLAGISRLASRPGYSQLYYDARGIARMRRLSGLPAHVFDPTDPRGLLLSLPTWEVDTLSDGLATRIIVTGRTPEKGAAPVGVASAPASHPLSPDRYRWHSVPLAWTREVSDETAATAAAATALAKQLLTQDLSVDQLRASVEAMPLPHLEPQDRIRVQHDSLGAELLLARMSIPVTGLGSATYGSARLLRR